MEGLPDLNTVACGPAKGRRTSAMRSPAAKDRRDGVIMTDPQKKWDVMIEVRGSTMAQFAGRLSGRLNRTVVDNTSITGRFNLHLEFTRGPQVFPLNDPSSRIRARFIREPQAGVG